MSVRRVLVANRGEIAVRIVRACFDEGIESVAAVSDADLDSLAARRADAVVRIGPAAASASYLDVGAIVGAAIATGCDAVHPGYGFLSERPELAAECETFRPGVRRTAGRGDPPRRQQDRRAGAGPLDRRAGGGGLRSGRHAGGGRVRGRADRLPGAAQGVGRWGRARDGPRRRARGAARRLRGGRA
jgi:acetyl-CoA carboxylase biotin carboxylase subunit